MTLGATIKDEIRELAHWHAETLQKQIEKRMELMQQDDKSHFLLYRVLGITDEEGDLIDAYQNKGRFLYKYVGSFLEQAAKYCFKKVYPEARSIRIPNTQGKRPKMFEIDCVIDAEAIEIKWRDATTDGDHITKEHTRLMAVHAAGYTPIRVMFYYPNREQARKIQQALETLYKGLNGHYYSGDAAWDYMHSRTGIDLKGILEELAAERMTAR
jgi:hypothetical protein